MSDPNKSNFQAFGAGLLGFLAVMAVGGGALLLHSSYRAKAPSKPVAAAEPIDLGAPTLHEAAAPAALPKERRAQSPAPLVGSDDDTELPADAAQAYAASAAAPAASSSPESAPNAKPSGRRLEATEHADLEGSARSSAESVNVNAPAPAARRGVRTAAAARKPMAKLAAGPSGPTAAVASVHYGVTSRDELMGRAAGPVYNIKGGSGAAKANNPAPGGKIASEMNERLALLQNQLDDNPQLTAEQRADIQKELSDLKKGVADVGGKR